MTTPQKLLLDEFNKRRARNPNFSLRAFAKWLGISPAQLSQMMTGKRPITFKSMNKIGTRLGLSPIEKKNIFSSILKDQHFVESMTQNKKLVLEEDQFRMISDWYHMAILSLTKVKEAQADPRWISRRLGISIEQAHQALLRLERMGIIEIKPKFKQITDPFETFSQVPSDAIRKYHKQNLNLAMEKIDTVPLHLRQFQSMPIPMNPKKLDAFKNLIDDFLSQVSDLADSQVGTEIYHMNVQLFPVTQVKEDHV